ncbi:MAG: type IX secretion/gliding motility protein PorT/SprT [Chitinophagaceae bacterium]
MQHVNLRHLQHLLRIQVLIGLVFLLFPTLTRAQYLNMPDHDEKPYYFGITLGFNQAYLKLTHTPYFLQQDTILAATPSKSDGFNLGLLANLRLNKRFDLRFNPELIFAENNLNFVVSQNGNTVNVAKNIESVLASLPLQIKFKSDRINNFRVYVIAGLKIDDDLASNANLRKSSDMIQLKPVEAGYEAGFGLEFFLPSFIFSPELKISNGFGNIHQPNPNLNYSNVIDQLNSRMIIFSIHIEG